MGATWRDGDGVVWPVELMTTQHLKNVVSFLDRNGIVPFRRVAVNELKRRGETNMAVKKNPIYKSEFIQSVVKGGTALMFRSVGNYDQLLDGELHLRPSTTRIGRLYLRAPQEWANGVYLTRGNALVLKEMLDKALDLAVKIETAPVSQSKVIVTTTDGQKIEYVLPGGVSVRNVTTV